MTNHPQQSFWHFRINWLVIGLPLSAVVAGISTLIIAIANPDPVIRPGSRDSGMRPAIEGRNHAMSAEQASQKPAEP